MRNSHAEEKRRLRVKMRAVRRALTPAVRAAAHAAMTRHLTALIPEAGVLALFAASPDEADPRGLLELVAPERVVWPRVHGPELELVQAAADELVPGYRGLLEPPKTRAAIALAEVGLVVVPGLAFDTAGHRLGQGGGHYDRLLTALRRDAPACRVVGLAYAAQLVASLPHEAHDQHVDLIVSEDGVVVP